MRGLELGKQNHQSATRIPPFDGADVDKSSLEVGWPGNRSDMASMDAS